MELDSAQPMEQSEAQEAARKGDPITARDVLRAIFTPPFEAEAAALPSIPRPKLFPAAPAPPDDVAAPPADLDTLATIHYEEPSPAPRELQSATRAAVIGVGAVTAILISILAQAAISVLEGGFGGGLLYALATLVWISLLLFEIAPPDGGLLRRGPTVSGGGAARPMRVLSDAALTQRALLAIGALSLSAAAYIHTANNLFTTPGVIAWAFSVLLWLVVAAERSPEDLIAGWIDRLTNVRAPTWETLGPRAVPLIAFALILGAAIFFRFYRLDAIPNDMTSDHVEKLLDAYRVTQGEYHVFFTNNAGREAIQFYLIPLIAGMFGTGMSFLSLKLTSALEALALIPLMILLGREVVDRETGFFAAALLAVSWWHTLLGRLALRIVLTPLVFTLLLITLIRGIRTGARRAWVWSGIWLGVGVYAYQALRIAPLVAVAAFAAAIAGPVARAVLAQWKGAPDAPHRQVIASNVAARQIVNLLCAGLVALAIFVPMLRVWHDFPDDLWNRVINRTTDREVAIHGSAAGVLVNNYARALGMFNVRGDSSWFSAVPNLPVLDLVTGGLFVLGVVAWLVRLRARRDPADAFLLAAGLVMLLPSALALAFPIENPSTTRASGMIPIVFLLAAWPLALVRQRWTAVLGRIPGMVLSGGLIAALMAGSIALNYNSFFVQYADSYRNSALNPREVVEAVRGWTGPDGSTEGVWLQGWPFWHDYRAIGIEAGDLEFQNAILDAPMLATYLNTRPEAFAARPLVFIVHPQDVEAQKLLRASFPDGALHTYRSSTECRDFYLFVVPSGE